MNWGKAIVLTFVLFAGFIGTLVYQMSRQQVDLVREDYYQDEIAYQKHIDRVENTTRFNQSIAMTYLADSQQVAFVLPASLRQGSITFYRPGDRKQDFRVPVSNSSALPKNRREVVSTRQLARGHWRVQFTWTDGQREYYTEDELFL